MQHRFIPTWLPILPLVVPLIACLPSEGDTNPFEPDLVCSRVPRCSIAEPACQQAVLAVTACVRGDATPSLPTIRTITREALRAELVASSAASELPSDRLSVLVVEKAFAAFGLVTDESSLTEASVDVSADSIAAMYEDEKKLVTIVSDTTVDPETAMMALSHELTHYLQHLENPPSIFDAKGLDIDRIVARKALIEGEALVTGFRSLAHMLGRQLDWTATFHKLDHNASEETHESDSPLLTAVSVLPYVLSARVIRDLWDLQGRARVDQLFTNPPKTELDWLSAGAPPVMPSTEVLDCYPPLPPEGFDLLGTDSLGLAGLYALTATQELPSIPGSADWRSDSMAFYVQRDATAVDSPTVLAVWRIRFRDDASAGRFAKLIAPLALQVVSFGRELAISVSSDPRTPPLAANQLAACPTEAELVATQRSTEGMAAAAMR